tara:strand:+ start:626 stop:841 length:216 start_codon:yes stop_codon:yes gene_type:complete
VFLKFENKHKNSNILSSQFKNNLKKMNTFKEIRENEIAKLLKQKEAANTQSEINKINSNLQAIGYFKHLNR